MTPCCAATHGRHVGRGGQRLIRGFQVSIGIVTALRCFTSSSTAFSLGIKSQPALGGQPASQAAAKPRLLEQGCLQAASKGHQLPWVASVAGAAALMLAAAARSSRLAVEPRTCTRALRHGWMVSTAVLGHSANGGRMLSAEQSGDPRDIDKGFSSSTPTLPLSTPISASLLALASSTLPACLGSTAQKHVGPVVLPPSRLSRPAISQAARLVGGARHVHSSSHSPRDRSTSCRAFRRSVGARLQPGPRAETPVISFDPSRLPQRLQLGLRESSRVPDQWREPKNLMDRKTLGRYTGVLGKLKECN